MSQNKNINKKGLDLIRKAFSQMISQSIKKQARQEAIKKFFLNDQGSIHDLLESVNKTCNENYGVDPIAIRYLQMILKKLHDEDELKLERVKPSQAELINKYGSPIPEKKRYSHRDKEVNINKGNFTFLKLKKGFVFKKGITKIEKSVIKEVVEIFKKNQGEGNEYSDLIDSLSDFISHDLISNNRIQGSQNKSYELAFKKIKQAINDGAVLEIKLKSRNKKQASKIDFHPHFLKMWKNKWYAFGYSPQAKKEPYVLPLDILIKEITPTLKKLKKSTLSYLDSNGNSKFFDDIIGITNIKERSPEKIKLKIHNKDRFNRLKLNRIHSSIDWNDEKKEITLEVKRNPELEVFIMEHADQIEVIAPLSLRKNIQKKVNKASKLYKSSV